ncbi:hypothetical protein B0J18DRAFT_479615 [Chaetomium sp. MPI-SDFR-AT-0129]|nr:hypothetical protein B0J18DRAFT_479615 [Chaetomium sp. MPI-SDFR-AT-0129]
MNNMAVVPTFTGFVGTSIDAALLAEAALVYQRLSSLLDRPRHGGLAPLAASGAVWVYGGDVRRWKDSRAWSDARNLGHGFNVYRETTKDPGEMMTQAEIDHETTNRADFEPYLGPLVGLKNAKRGGLVKKAIMFTLGGKDFGVVAYYTMADVLREGYFLRPRDVLDVFPPRVPVAPAAADGSDEPFFVGLRQDYWRQPAKAARRAVMADDNNQTRPNAGAVWRTDVAEVAWEMYKGSGPNGISPFNPVAEDGGLLPEGDVVPPGAATPGGAASPLGVVPAAPASGANNVGLVGQNADDDNNIWGLGNPGYVPVPDQQHQQGQLAQQQQQQQQQQQKPDQEQVAQQLQEMHARQLRGNQQVLDELDLAKEEVQGFDFMKWLREQPEQPQQQEEEEQQQQQQQQQPQQQQQLQQQQQQQQQQQEQPQEPQQQELQQQPATPVWDHENQNGNPLALLHNQAQAAEVPGLDLTGLDFSINEGMEGNDVIMGGMNDFNMNEVDIGPQDNLHVNMDYDMPDSDAANPAVAPVPDPLAPAAPPLFPPAAADAAAAPAEAPDADFDDNFDADFDLDADADAAGLGANFPPIPGLAPPFDQPVFIPGTGWAYIIPSVDGLDNHIIPLGWGYPGLLPDANPLLGGQQQQQQQQDLGQGVVGD